MNFNVETDVFDTFIRSLPSNGVENSGGHKGQEVEKSAYKLL